MKSIAVTANEQLCGPFEFADATSFSFTGENEGYTVTLDCGEGVQLDASTATNFYVYLPPKDSYTAGMKIVVTSTEGKTFEKTTTTAVKIERNNLYTFDWTATFAPVLPAGALKGEFSVSGTKKVHFSQGNLKYEGTKWKFYDHQYDYLTGSDRSPVSLFPWGYDASKNISLDSNEYVKTHTQKGDKLVYDKASSEGGDDWGVAYCESNNITVGIWRTLSKEEWEYLIKTRTMTNGKARYSIADRVTIGSTKYTGLFLYPDNYNGEVDSGSMTWDAINAAGIVFLPAAGYYDGGHVTCDDSKGFYWSSSAYSEYSSYLMYFDNTGTVRPDKGDDEYDDCKRQKNYSVRLVTEVPGESGSGTLGNMDRTNGTWEK